MSAADDPDELLKAVLGTPRRSGGMVWVALNRIVDEARTEAVDRAVLDLASRHAQVVLDFSGVSKVGSDWLRLLKRLSEEGDLQGVRVGWHGVPDLVRRTADWLEISQGLHFDDESGG